MPKQKLRHEIVIFLQNKYIFPVLVFSFENSTDIKKIVINITFFLNFVSTMGVLLCPFGLL